MISSLSQMLDSDRIKFEMFAAALGLDVEVLFEWLKEAFEPDGLLRGWKQIAACVNMHPATMRKLAQRDADLQSIVSKTSTRGRNARVFARQQDIVRWWKKRCGLSGQPSKRMNA